MGWWRWSVIAEVQGNEEQAEQEQRGPALNQVCFPWVWRSAGLPGTPWELRIPEQEFHTHLCWSTAAASCCPPQKNTSPSNLGWRACCLIKFVLQTPNSCSMRSFSWRVGILYSGFQQGWIYYWWLLPQFLLWSWRITLSYAALRGNLHSFLISHQHELCSQKLVLIY